MFTPFPAVYNPIKGTYIQFPTARIGFTMLQTKCPLSVCYLKRPSPAVGKIAIPDIYFIRVVLRLPCSTISEIHDLYLIAHNSFFWHLLGWAAEPKSKDLPTVLRIALFVCVGTYIHVHIIENVYIYLSGWNCSECDCLHQTEKHLKNVDERPTLCHTDWCDSELPGQWHSAEFSQNDSKQWATFLLFIATVMLPPLRYIFIQNVSYFAAINCALLPLDCFILPPPPWGPVRWQPGFLLVINKSAAASQVCLLLAKDHFKTVCVPKNCVWNFGF